MGFGDDQVNALNGAQGGGSSVWVNPDTVGNQDLISTVLNDAHINNPNGSFTLRDGNTTTTFGPEFIAPIGASNSSIVNSVKDLRVRIRAQTGQESSVYGPNANQPLQANTSPFGVSPLSSFSGTSQNSGTSTNLLSIMYETRGMLFPYTPTVTFSQNVDYKSLDLVHTNQDFYAYSRTPSVDINLTGDFTVQNQREGVYALACIHFLRTVSKMHFGETDPNRGLPPPVLLFSGYGNFMFNDLRVIVRNHSFNLDKNIDYVTINTANGQARLPSLFQINVQLTVQNTPQNQRKNFNLDKFRTGDLMRNGNTGWI